MLGDRAQAPSGAGYAIENRLALARAMPDIYRATRVAARRAVLPGVASRNFPRSTGSDDTRVCLLTPGPMNETYFEHAYLARYLGLLLVEGEDLTVRDDGVFIRTVSGLRRAEVLLRRLDADFADPLELNAASRLGVAGLVQAVRDGNVVIANALGAGLIEARAMLAFLPALAPAVLGEDLAMPNVATWWLGRADIREQMIGAARQHGDRAGVSPTSLPGFQLGNGLPVAALDEARRRELMQSIEDRGVDYVVQEAVTLSTMPVWRDGRLLPRPFTLRLFLAKVGDTLAGHAGRLRAHRRDRRCPRRQPAARRRDRRRLGAVGRPVPEDDAAADAGAHGRAARDRSAAEPRRRQSVLGRPLCGARRSDAAADPRAARRAWPRPRTPPRRSSPASARCSAPGAPRRPTAGRRPPHWSRGPR